MWSRLSLFIGLLSIALIVPLIDSYFIHQAHLRQTRAAVENVSINHTQSQSNEHSGNTSNDRLMAKMEKVGKEIMKKGKLDQYKLPDVIIGNPNAPKTLIVYYSLTCHLCRDFRLNILPVLKERYIDKGKLNVIIRDYVFDGIAFKLATVSRCRGEEKYLTYTQKILENQDKILDAKDQLKAADQFLATLGFTPQEIQECSKKEKTVTGIAVMVREAEERYGIDAAPAYVINGEMYRGKRSLEKLEQLLGF